MTAFISELSLRLFFVILKIEIMKANMGRIDKILRFTVAVIIALLVYYNVVDGVLSYILLAVAAVFVLTSLTGFCPLYGLFGISSCRIRKTDKP